MEIKLSPQQLDLYNSIDEILWKDWDPVGISKTGSRDEYYAYLPDVFRLVQQSAPTPEIAEYLHQVAKDKMGLISSVDDHWEVAQKIHSLQPAK